MTVVDAAAAVDVAVVVTVGRGSQGRGSCRRRESPQRAGWRRGQGGGGQCVEDRDRSQSGSRGGWANAAGCRPSPVEAGPAPSAPRCPPSRPRRTCPPPRSRCSSSTAWTLSPDWPCGSACARWADPGPSADARSARPARACPRRPSGC